MKKTNYKITLLIAFIIFIFASCKTEDTSSDAGTDAQDVSGQEDISVTDDIINCIDNDGDQYGEGDDCLGTDCDDHDPDNWISCSTCIDSDSDNYFANCDSYTTIQGPDCDDSSSLCSTDCSDENNNNHPDCDDNCVDTDRDGYGEGDDCLGLDCNDDFSACNSDCSDHDNDGMVDCCLKAPFEVGFYDTPGTAMYVYVKDNYAFVADKYEGLRIIDISDAASPVEIGFYQPSEEVIFWKIYVKNNYAYIADYNYGLRIIDISNTSSPVEVGSYSRCDQMYLNSNYLFCGDNNYNEVAILDIVDVTNPVKIASWDFHNEEDSNEMAAIQIFGMDGNENCFIVTADYTYVDDHENRAHRELIIVDIDNILDPVAVYSDSYQEYSYSVYVSGNYAFVDRDTSSIKILDISDPALPVSHVNYDVCGVYYVNGHYAFGLECTGILKILDINNINNIEVIGSYDPGVSVYGVYVSGNYAYLAEGDQGLRILSLNCGE